MEYTVDYFIAKFEAIPEEKWFIGDFINIYNPEQKCAYGHCGCIKSLGETIESNMLFDLFDNPVHYINDGHDEKYQQSTPKQRILAALHDIKKQQENG